jgi:hypothetical protein
VKRERHEALAAALYLAARREAILAGAAELLAARAPRYQRAGQAAIESRLEALYACLVRVLVTGELTPLLEHARSVADTRFRTGVGLGEVQAAYNALEEAIWRRVLADGNPRRYAVVLPSVSAAVGAAKDALARDYVELAARAQAPSIDVDALARGLGRA